MLTTSLSMSNALLKVKTGTGAQGGKAGFPLQLPDKVQYMYRCGWAEFESPLSESSCRSGGQVALAFCRSQASNLGPR